MRIPDPASLLDAWDQGRGCPPGERALRLLELAWPQTSREELATLPLGERDAQLAALRAHLFGPRAEALLSCPACLEHLEFPLDLQAMYRQPDQEEERTRGGEITVGGSRVRFRVPCSADVLAVRGMEPEQGERVLLRRCIEAMEGEDSPDALPEPVKAAIEQAMEEADPRANVVLSLRCPACGHPWQATFDMVGFFWQELEDWARRCLLEVHTLARAYGWSEQEILALSPWRRQIYLELIET